MGAPSQLSQMGLDPAVFKQATRGEWHGVCPFCGGTDRFRVRVVRVFPGWWWACRQCKRQGWADQLNESLRTPPTEAERAKWAQAQRQKQIDNARETQSRLSEFTSGELWAELHRRMSETERAQWRAWGIPDEWQNYLELGYTPHYSQSIDTPAFTIPYFHHRDGKRSFSTMQYRLVNAPNPADRYRFAYGLASTFYETTPTEPLHDTVIICEGAKKAMNMKIRGGVNKTTSVLAVPGKASHGGIVDRVRECGRVFVALDPDGLKESKELCRCIGKQARLVELPGKLDDLILMGIGRAELQSAFRWAVRA